MRRYYQQRCSTKGCWNGHIHNQRSNETSNNSSAMFIALIPWVMNVKSCGHQISLNNTTITVWDFISKRSCIYLKKQRTKNSWLHCNIFLLFQQQKVTLMLWIIYNEWKIWNPDNVAAFFSPIYFHLSLIYTHHTCHSFFTYMYIACSKINIFRTTIQILIL